MTLTVFVKKESIFPYWKYYFYWKDDKKAFS